MAHRVEEPAGGANRGQIDAGVQMVSLVGMILSEISDELQKGVREVLHGMIRERAGGATNAVLTAPLMIGWGWKQ